MEIKNQLKDYFKLMIKLVENDLKSRYSGSALGIVWAFVQPMITILVFWYVFQLGFKTPPVENIEYILWFIAGYIPWTYFNDGIMTSTNAMYEYSYLIKKIRFKVELIPLIKVISSLYIHLFFNVFILSMYLLYGYQFKLKWLSILYYSFCMTILLIGLSYAVSSLSVFIKDASQIISIALQIGFWLTPIFWSDSIMNENVLNVLKMNPMYYIVNGYRNTLIAGQGFWQQDVKNTILYWITTIIIMVVGLKIYRNLKKHFSDLL